MGAVLVVNYADMKNKYLKLSADKTVMYINCTTVDGNITYIEETTGNKHFYELTNVFFKTQAETLLNDATYSLEMQMFHVNPNDPTDMAIVSVLFDSTLDIEDNFITSVNPNTNTMN